MIQERILFLGPKDSPLLSWLRNNGERIYQMSDIPPPPPFIDREGFSFLISYGYRYIIKKEILDIFPSRAINLHISYLPWNRGADPNFWSFAEDTPKGVSIHYLNEGIDTGDIIVQKKIKFDSDSETLATSYKKLHSAIQELFKQHWNEIKKNTCQRKKQVGNGSLHKIKDKELLSHLLIKEWNTPISVLEEYAAETQMSMQFWEKYNSEVSKTQKHSEII